MKLLFIMDPIEKVQINADTTFALMLAGQDAGHDIYYCGYEALYAESSSGGSQCRADVNKISVRRDDDDFYTTEETTSVNVGKFFDGAFMRTDPPFDTDYLHATHLLQIAENAGCTVLNRPDGLRNANEKLYALHFPSLIPDTIVTASSEKIKEFTKNHDGIAVVKPVDGHGGAGIFVITSDDKNLNSMIEVSTKDGTERVICQSYLPKAREGDKRILMLNGEPLGALMRIPKADEHRGNMHVGGTSQKSTLTENDKKICDLVGPKLKEDGLYFVGLDVIGDALTEVNVTSPTGIQEMSRYDGVDYSARVISWLEEFRT